MKKANMTIANVEHRRFNFCRFNSFAAAWLVLTLAAVSSTNAHAETGISVSGTATVKAKPTEVDIVGTISGEGELANDASVKFHDSRKKAIAAIDNMKNPDLSVESEGSDVHDSIDAQQQMRMMQGQTTEQPKTRTQITEKLKLRLKNIDRLDNDKLLEAVLKLVDASRDAGISIGSTAGGMNVYQMQMQMQNGGGNADSLLQFKIPDSTDLQTEACKQAIADARAKAQRIADLTGVKLGKVVSVHDLNTTDTGTASMNGQDHQVQKEAISTSLGDLSITVRLQVEFEIEK